MSVVNCRGKCSLGVWNCAHAVCWISTTGVYQFCAHCVYCSITVCCISAMLLNDLMIVVRLRVRVEVPVKLLTYNDFIHLLHVLLSLVAAVW